MVRCGAFRSCYPSNLFVREWRTVWLEWWLRELLSQLPSNISLQDQHGHCYLRWQQMPAKETSQKMSLPKSTNTEPMWTLKHPIVQLTLNLVRWPALVCFCTGIIFSTSSFNDGKKKSMISNSCKTRPMHYFTVRACSHQAKAKSTSLTCVLLHSITAMSKDEEKIDSHLLDVNEALRYIPHGITKMAIGPNLASEADALVEIDLYTFPGYIYAFYAHRFLHNVITTFTIH